MGLLANNVRPGYAGTERSGKVRSKEIGFAELLGGYGDMRNNTFGVINDTGFWWSVEGSSNDGFVIFQSADFVNMSDGTGGLFSVRYVKD